MSKIDLSENEFFEKFVGPDHIDSNNVQFWFQLLSCSFNFTRVHDPKSVDKTLKPFIDLLALNNSQSLNIGSLIRVTLDRVSRIKSRGSESTNSYYVFQSFNALYLLKTICKNFIENSSEEMLLQALKAKVDVSTSQQQSSLRKQVNTAAAPLVLQQSSQVSLEQANTVPPVNAAETKVSPQLTDEPLAAQDTTKEEVTSGQTMLDNLISTLIEIIVDTPLNDSTYLLQVEAINSILVLLSVQMYSNNLANQFYTFRTLMQKKCSIHALILTKTLLNNFIRQDQIPQEHGSIILGLASGIWKVLTLGYGQGEDDYEEMPYLARQSLLLLNVLTNHYTTGKNPYREAIIHCQDSKFNPSDPKVALDFVNNDAVATASTSQHILAANNIKIDFDQLFDTVCKYLHDDQVALLLYLLLHSNRIFKPYILTTAAKKLDLLALPLLKILYSNIQKGSHHIYMVLIIFVILSEEVSFSDSIHKIPIKGITWYKDRMINDISLASFAALITIRSFQYNTFRIKDKFLHTNLFATLGNLSNHMVNLHPYVCQRLVDLLERLTKRYQAISKPSTKSDPLPKFPPSSPEFFKSNDPLARALATDTQKQEYTQDASAIELNSAPILVQQADQSNTTIIQDSANASNAINITIPEQSQSNLIIDHGSGKTNPLPPVGDREFTAINGGLDNGLQSPGNASQADQINITMDDSKMDIAWIEEIIRMLLEIINNLLDSQMEKNPDMIYTLLYKRSVISSLLASHPSFYNMVINIERILTFFYNKIENHQRQMSVEEIKELISLASLEWTLSQPAKNDSPQLLFRYVEDDQPEDFFIPYMWTKIYYSSGIVWNPKRIVLFNPELA